MIKQQMHVYSVTEKESVVISLQLFTATLREREMKNRDCFYGGASFMPAAVTRVQLNGV